MTKTTSVGVRYCAGSRVGAKLTSRPRTLRTSVKSVPRCLHRAKSRLRALRNPARRRALLELLCATTQRSGAYRAVATSMTHATKRAPPTTRGSTSHRRSIGSSPERPTARARAASSGPTISPPVIVLVAGSGLDRPGFSGNGEPQHVIVDPSVSSSRIWNRWRTPDTRCHGTVVTRPGLTTTTRSASKLTLGRYRNIHAAHMTNPTGAAPSANTCQLPRTTESPRNSTPTTATAQNATSEDDGLGTVAIGFAGLSDTSGTLPPWWRE